MFFLSFYYRRGPLDAFFAPPFSSSTPLPTSSERGPPCPGAFVECPGSCGLRGLTQQPHILFLPALGFYRRWGSGREGGGPPGCKLTVLVVELVSSSRASGCCGSKMFRRPLGAGNQSALGNKDKKRLREQLLRSFPLLSENDLEQLLPAKELMSVVRLNLPQASQAGGGPQQPEALPPLMSASSANKCTLYVLDDVAVVAEVNGLLFPTVHGLWRAPKMLPCFLIFSPVSAFVMKGADLMLPGVCRPLTAAAAAATASAVAAAGAEAAAAAAGGGGIAPGQLWAVRVVGNALPFAVGRAVTRAPSLELLGDKGRTLELIHHLGDALWKYGKEVALPPLFSYKQVYSGTDDADLLAACGMGPPESLPGSLQQGDPHGRQQQGEEEGGEVSPSDAAEDAAATPAAAAVADAEGELQQQGDSGEALAVSGDERSQGEAERAAPSMTPEEIDAYLELCLLETLHAVTDEQLPLDISALYSKLTAEAPAIYYTRIARGDAPFIAPDIRRSSAKKLGKFAQTASKKKLLQTKEQRGVVSVVKINRSHPDYVKHAPVPDSQKRKLIERAAAAAAGAAAQQAGPTIEEGGAPREAPAAAAGARSTSGPLVFEFCVPASKCSRIFAAAGVRSGKNIYFTSQEYREVLEKYLEVRDSKREDVNQQGVGAPPPSSSSRPVRSSAVLMDPLLAEAGGPFPQQTTDGACMALSPILTKEERGDAKAAGSEPQLMEKAELFQRWQETQQPCHAVLRSNDELPLLQDRIVKGACSPIRITVEDKFGGRKHATHILNAANFLLDPKTVADFLQKKLAASASLYAPPGVKTTSAVCVQGNVAGPVAELLISHFGIPKKYIEVEIKKPKSAR
ncbi:hypothetical protein Emag_002309 [Eimeria magna]